MIDSIKKLHKKVFNRWKCKYNKDWVNSKYCKKVNQTKITYWNSILYPFVVSSYSESQIYEYIARVFYNFVLHI